MDSTDLCIRCNKEFNFIRRAPCTLPCDHVICIDCRDKVMRHLRGDNVMKSLKCPGCKVESKFNILEMDKKVSDYRAANTSSVKQTFICHQHDGQKLGWFIPKMG